MKQPSFVARACLGVRLGQFCVVFANINPKGPCVGWISEQATFVTRVQIYDMQICRKCAIDVQQTVSVLQVERITLCMLATERRSYV